MTSSSSGALPYATADYFRSGVSTQFVPLEDLANCVVTQQGLPVLIWDGSNAGEVFVGKSAVLASTMALLKPDAAAIDPGFCYFFLKTAFSELNGGTTGSTIPHVSKLTLTALQIPTPALAEQRLIANLLSKMESAIKLQAQMVEATAELKRAAMRELFTRGLRGEPQKETEIGPVPESWEPTACERIFKLTSGKTRPNDLQPVASSESPYPVLGGNGVMGYSASWNVDAPAIMVIGRVGEYCGAVHLAAGKVWITDNALYTREWLLHEAQFGFVAKFLEYYDLNRFKRMAGQPLVTQGMINEHAIPLPCPDEQREIVTILEAIDRKIALHRQKRAVLEELFKALLHKLMTGEIRVADLDLSALESRHTPHVAA
jgi:type I restriction enzyme S subunit